MTPSGSGAVLSIPFVPVVEGVLSAGFSWTIIDAEHSPLSRSDQVTMIAVAQRFCSPVLVRVANTATIGDALDAGADGVVVPMVNSAAEAEVVVAAVHHPPRGTRSIGPYRAARSAPLCITQIETTGAVERAHEIADTDGVDALMIGPGDLAQSAGLMPGLDSHHDDMVAMYRQVLDVCRDLGKPAGTFSLLGPEDAERTWQLEWAFVADFHDRLALQIAAARYLNDRG